jgi:hypothetical protein
MPEIAISTVECTHHSRCNCQYRDIVDGKEFLNLCQVLTDQATIRNDLIDNDGSESA